MDNHEYTDISFDLETLGRGDNSVITQIGAFRHLTALPTLFKAP